MSEIKVVTKGNESPQGKSRVYFSCHPDDFKLYFEDIKKEIFETQDCAIFYEADWTDNADDAEQPNHAGDAGKSEGLSDELVSSLSEMNLFIVIVTTKFLYHDCRALTYEYGFAMEHHIPVIPIAMEAGLGKNFTERLNKVKSGYGDVQYLNRTSTDITEIPYKEKLKNSLEMVLVGDELSKRVRAAFDAYIFLSYRKKDRAYAKELMHMIHSIPFCRDIAIWYDEFLVPGEGWNDAIAEAMAKSKLVTMAVTPSLVEPNNFIIRHEYPDAVKAGKEVIPVEMEKVDYNLLSELFAGINIPVDGYDSKALSETLNSSKGLSEILKQIAIKENDNEREHNFLIGLAYLNGIDVEHDNERAVKLITTAAEAKLSEAMKKLVNMYNTGDGVERNYQTAVEWQEKYVQLLEGRAEKDKRILWQVMIEQDKLGDMLYALRKIEKARICYQKELGIAESITKETGTVESRHNLSVSYNKLGNISQAEGKKAEAREYYQKGLEIAETLAKETGTVLSHSDLSISYEKLGDISKAEGKLTEAWEYYLKGLEIRENLAKETGTVESRRSLLGSYYKLGITYEKVEKYDEAKNYYLKAFEISQELFHETKSDSAGKVLRVVCNQLQKLSELFDQLGDDNISEGNISEAKSYYLNGLKCLEGLSSVNEDAGKLAESINSKLKNLGV